MTESPQVQSHLQISTPVDSIFNEFDEIISPYENTEDRLLSKTMRIPELQSLTNSLLSQPSCAVDVSRAFDLIRAAIDLDSELAHWARKVPIEWSYTTALRMKYFYNPRLSSSTFVPNQAHRYPDLYTARVWNLYRVSRLIIQSILFRVSSCVDLHLKDHYRDRTDKINRSMVEDMCASVPFLLGYDFSELKRSTSSFHGQNLWPQTSVSKATSSAHTGKFSLIWPLYIACSVSSVPEAQRRWMRAQLRWIAETGEAQAQFVHQAESQTLAGGVESFRFDCV